MPNPIPGLKMPNSKNIKIRIFGATGYLGSSCVHYFRSAGYQILDKRVDITDPSALSRAFHSEKPDVAINLTGPPSYPTIDWCEDHKEETVKMIVSAPINFTLAASESGAYPIQLTSGCIYNGGTERQFTEDDAPNFFGSFYSRMRIVGQEALKELPVLQARIRMPISIFNNPRNFIDKITSYKKVISIPNSVTLIEDLWPAMEKLISSKPVGILNLTNEGYLEHKQVLEAYKRIVDPSHSYELITLKQLQGPGGITKAKRSNCILSTNKARSFGIFMPALNGERLDKIMKKYRDNIK